MRAYQYLLRSRRLRRSRGAVAAAVAIVTVGLFAGAARAYWTAIGSGTGSATTATLEGVTIDSVTIASERLAPGGAPVPVRITVRNANAFPVSLTAVSAGPVSSDKPGCGDAGHPSGVSLDVAGSVVVIPASSTAEVLRSAQMATTSPSACQGAVFSTDLTLDVRR
jgi:hypothetical protein